LDEQAQCQVPSSRLNDRPMRRAEAVVTALTTTHGIAPGRLKGYGVGALAPVASNDGEEGRAKNRRVELVKQ
jgi:OmpA-OmpF porin, OOP family